MYNPKQLYLYRRREEWGATAIVFATADELIALYGQGHRHHKTDEQILEAAIRLSKAVLYKGTEQIENILEEILDR